MDVKPTLTMSAKSSRDSLIQQQLFSRKNVVKRRDSRPGPKHAKDAHNKSCDGAAEPDEGRKRMLNPECLEASSKTLQGETTKAGQPNRAGRDAEEVSEFDIVSIKLKA